MSWNVIYTKSKSEKAVAEKLRQAGIEVYCPLLKTRRRWSDRWKWVEEPLFRSYCFVNISESERQQVLYITGVQRYIYHCGRPAIVRDGEIEILRNWLEIYSHDSLAVEYVSPADRVSLKTGPLVDMVGSVEKVKGNFATIYLKDLTIRVRVDLRKNVVEKI